MALPQQPDILSVILEKERRFMIKKVFHSGIQFL